MTRHMTATLLTVLLCATHALGGTITIAAGYSYDVTETRVNEYTSNEQQYPTVAVLENDRFIVGWESWYQRGYGSDCYGKVYSADGTAVGSEFHLNPYNYTGWEYGQAFAPQPGGGFAVAWGDNSTSVYVQRFDGDMNPIGEDSLVMTVECWPAISSAPNGDFVVAGGQYDSPYPIKARRYQSSGTPYGPAWQVNTDPPGFSGHTAASTTIGVAPDGTFTVVWHNASGDIRAQRYDSGGTAVGAEFTVNSSTGGGRGHPSIVYTSAGEMIISWSGNGDEDPDGIYARRFAADCSPLGDEWLVNGTTSGSRTRPNLAAADSNEFVISWSANDGDDWGVYARLYDTLGDPVGSEFQVNEWIGGSQLTPWASGRTGTAIIDDTLLFTWYGAGDGDSEGVYLATFQRQSEIPEPASIILTAFGALGVAAWARRAPRINARRR